MHLHKFDVFTEGYILLMYIGHITLHLYHHDVPFSMY